MADLFNDHYKGRLPDDVSKADTLNTTISHAYAHNFPTGHNPSDGPDETLVPIGGVLVAIAVNEVSGDAGAFIPHGVQGAADLAELQANATLANPDTVWDTGSYVVLGDKSTAYWNGTAWVEGVAP